MQRQEVRFHSGDSIVRGWFFAPPGRGTHPAVVWCPGFTGTKYAAFAVPYFQALNAAGVGVLAADYRGWGDSEGPRGTLYPAEQVEDLRNALSYLETRSDVRSDALGVFGVSFGGGHAVSVAGLDPRVRCAIAVSPVGDGEAWLKAMRDDVEWTRFTQRLAQDRRRRVRTGVGQRVDPVEDIMIQSEERRSTTVKGTSPHDGETVTTPLACADAVRDYRPVLVADRVSPRALLVVVFEGDTVVDPLAHGEAIHARAAEPKRIVRLPGKDHYRGYVEFADTIIAESVGWCRRFLLGEEPR